MTRAIHALVDGLPVETVSIDDRGLQYGHGMLETCRVVNGRIPLWQLHHARLSATAARLHIPLDIAAVDDEVRQLAAMPSDAVLKILVTAGDGGRGYRSDDGRLVEGTTTNLFLVRDGGIVTPDLSRCGVAGVMRQLLLEKRPGIDEEIETRDVAIEELDEAEECFLTNAVIGIWPVARILGRDRAQLRPVESRAAS